MLVCLFDVALRLCCMCATNHNHRRQNQVLFCFAEISKVGCCVAREMEEWKKGLNLVIIGSVTFPL